MKKFTIPCNFGKVRAPFDVYIGGPPSNRHPLHYQANWLRRERGGEIPPEVMESFMKLYELSVKHNVSFEDLCVHAMKAVNQQPKPEPGVTAPPSSTEDAK